MHQQIAPERPGLKLVSRLKPVSHVRCVDCGYLDRSDPMQGWDQILPDGAPRPLPMLREAAPGLSISDRERIRFRRFRATGSLTCFRQIPFYDAAAPGESLRQDELEKVIYDATLAARICPWFQAYEPGLMPEDHRMRSLQSAAPIVRSPIDRDYWVMTGTLAAAAFFFGLVIRPIVEGALGLAG